MISIMFLRRAPFLERYLSVFHDCIVVIVEPVAQDDEGAAVHPGLKRTVKMSADHDIESSCDLCANDRHGDFPSRIGYAA